MSEVAESVNAEIRVKGSSEQEKSEELCRPKFQWCSKPYHNVATVRPLKNGGECSSLPTTQSISPASTHASFSPEQVRRSRQNFRNWTLPAPFSFDARDSVQRAAHAKRMEELREMEKSHLELASRFIANPVRKYKPLVLAQSTRPLTVPRDPFSSRDT